jgi:hypothetical protein
MALSQKIAVLKGNSSSSVPHGLLEVNNNQIAEIWRRIFLNIKKFPVIKINNRIYQKL